MTPRTDYRSPAQLVGAAIGYTAIVAASLLLLVTLTACAGGTDAEKGAATGGGGGGAKAATTGGSRTVASGTTIEVTLRDSMSSRRNTVGNPLNAVVSQDVMDGKGKVAIPAGSPVAVHISAISPAKAGTTSAEGTLELTVTSITVNGATHDVNVVLKDVPHTMVGRGVTKGVAEDIGVGAAIGAIAGQAIGKNTKSTVIGAAAGAAAGGAVAVAGAQRDIVVAPNTRVMFTLPQAVTIAAR